MNVTLSCNVNPDVLHIYPIEPVSRKQSSAICIVGGGVAGMEAARTLALQGRRVILYERETTLGGTVALASKGPGRTELGLITDYLQAELERLGVEVRTGVEVTAQMLIEQRFSAIIIATGAHMGTGLLPIPGHDLPHVTDVRRVLAGQQVNGQRVVVIDESDSHGVLSAIELLASQGKQVEVVTEDWYVGRDLVATQDLTGWMQRTLPHNVIHTPHTSIVRVESDGVVVADKFADDERFLPADVVVLGTYERPSSTLYDTLKGRVQRLYRVGDCVTPRRIEQAIAEGRQVGVMIARAK